MSAANVVKNLNNKPFNCENRIKFGWFSHFFEFGVSYFMKIIYFCSRFQAHIGPTVIQKNQKSTNQKRILE